MEDDLGTSNELDAGIDLTWKPRERTVVDATILPDFSQIEADVPQLTANTLFALAVTEKRPFLLEGTDLLTTPLQAIYTRAFTDPDAGVRITDRSARHEYTALALRDAGGGAVIAPGPINSRLALQDFGSSAFVARNRFLLDDTSLGMLATGRFNDDGSQNVLIGADGIWKPSAADQVTAQFLTAQTRNPDLPDLLDVWGAALRRQCWLFWVDTQQQQLVYRCLIRVVLARLQSMEWVRHEGWYFIVRRCGRLVLLSRQRWSRHAARSEGGNASCRRQRRRTDQPVDRSRLYHPRSWRHDRLGHLVPTRRRLDACRTAYLRVVRAVDLFDAVRLDATG